MLQPDLPGAFRSLFDSMTRHWGGFRRERPQGFLEVVLVTLVLC